MIQVSSVIYWDILLCCGKVGSGLVTFAIYIYKFLMGNGKMPRIRGDVLRLTLGYFYGSYISWLASSAFLTQHGIHANNACVTQFCN